MARRPYFTSALAWLAGILILASGCMDQSPTATLLDPATVSAEQAQMPGNPRAIRAAAPFEAGTRSAVINPAGGSIDFEIGTIVFPRGAVDRATFVTATVDGETMSVEFGPHGLTFPEGAGPILTFRSAGLDLSAGAVIYYVDGNGNILERLDAEFDAVTGTAAAGLKHFSPYILAAG